MNWQNYPFIRIVLPFILGMTGAYLFATHMDMVILFVLCCALLSSLFFLLRKPKNKYRSTAFGIVAMTLSFAVGMALYTRKYQSIAQGIPQDSTFCKGVLSAMPREKANSWALNLKQDNGAHIILYIGKSKKDTTNDSECFSRLNVGDTIFAKIRHLTATKGDDNVTKGSDDATFVQYHEYLFSQGICATCYTPSDQWHSRPRQSAASIFHSAKQLQHKLHSTYNEHGIDGESGNIIEAMTIGMKENLDADTRRHYATAGTSHVLAMSGMHVGLIAIILQFFFITNMMPHQWLWICNICIIALLWCFAAIAGLSPSLIRATLMFTTLLLCQSFTHEVISINSCALAIAIMLCINPLYLNDAGFQLSFVSVGSICILGQLQTHPYPPHSRILYLLKRIAYISLICTIATAPLVAYHFGSIPLMSVASNIAIIPFVYIIMFGSLLWWLFLWLAPVNTLLTNVLNWSADTMNNIVEGISTVPHASIEWQPNAVVTALCYIPFLTIAYILTIKLNRR